MKNGHKLNLTCVDCGVSFEWPVLTAATARGERHDAETVRIVPASEARADAGTRGHVAQFIEVSATRLTA